MEHHECLKRVQLQTCLPSCWVQTIRYHHKGRQNWCDRWPVMPSFINVWWMFRFRQSHKIVMRHVNKTKTCLIQNKCIQICWICNPDTSNSTDLSIKSVVFYCLYSFSWKLAPSNLFTDESWKLWWPTYNLWCIFIKSQQRFMTYDFITTYSDSVTM